MPSGDRIVVFDLTFNNSSSLSWISVLLVEETGVPGENHRLITQITDKFYHLMQTSPFELTMLVVIGTDCTCSCKSYYHAITTTATSE